MNTDKDFEYIDSYLEGALSAEEEVKFKNRVSEDEEFNKTYQFILSVREASKIADEVRRIKDMLNAEPLGGFTPDTTSEGKIISIKRDDEKPALEQGEKIEQTRLLNLWPYLKYASVAATIAIIFFIWQPTRSTNEEVFASYTSGELGSNQIAMLDSRKKSERYSIDTGVNDRMSSIRGNLRGDESKPENYTYDEWQEVLKAIEMVRTREYSKAKKIFGTTLKPNESNPQLLLNYAIAQLHSNEVENAISTLEQLKSDDESYSEYISFHLAMGYIKIGKVKDARALLKTVKNNGGELSNQASTVLESMRWF